jgi:hypothetical protein
MQKQNSIDGINVNLRTYLPETRSASDHADDSTARCDSAMNKTIKDRGEDNILERELESRRCDAMLVPKNVCEKPSHHGRRSLDAKR